MSAVYSRKFRIVFATATLIVLILALNSSSRFTVQSSKLTAAKRVPLREKSEAGSAEILPTGSAGVPPAKEKQHDAGGTPALHSNYGNIPLQFERNSGQTDAQVKYLS